LPAGIAPPAGTETGVAGRKKILPSVLEGKDNKQQSNKKKQ